MIGVGLSQVLTGVLSERVDVRVLSAALGTVVICYAGAWSLVSARLRSARPTTGATTAAEVPERTGAPEPDPVGSAPAQRS